MNITDAFDLASHIAVPTIEIDYSSVDEILGRCCMKLAHNYSGEIGVSYGFNRDWIHVLGCTGEGEARIYHRSAELRFPFDSRLFDDMVELILSRLRRDWSKSVRFEQEITITPQAVGVVPYRKEHSSVIRDFDGMLGTIRGQNHNFIHLSGENLSQDFFGDQPVPNMGEERRLVCTGRTETSVTMKWATKPGVSIEHLGDRCLRINSENVAHDFFGGGEPAEIGDYWQFVCVDTDEFGVTLKVT